MVREGKIEREGRKGNERPTTRERGRERGGWEGGGGESNATTPFDWAVAA